MKWNEYLVESARFENKTLNAPQLQSNAILGLMGEMGELADLFKKFWYHDHPENREHVLKESGDILWYLALYCRGRQCRIDRERVAHITQTWPESRDIKQFLLIMQSAFTNLLNSRSDPWLEEVNAVSIAGAVGCIASIYDSSLEEVMDMNITKLSARYPDGFSTEASLHRKEGDI